MLEIAVNDKDKLFVYFCCGK